MAALLNAANAAGFPDNSLPAFKTMLKLSAAPSRHRAGTMAKHKPTRKRSTADEGLIVFIKYKLLYNGFEPVCKNKSSRVGGVPNETWWGERCPSGLAMTRHRGS